jgi:hypothetical protein
MLRLTTWLNAFVGTPIDPRQVGIKVTIEGSYNLASKGSRPRMR